MPLIATTVAAQIATLGVTGLRIRDLSDIPQVINQRECPIMVPDTNFITNFNAPRANVTRTNPFRDANRQLNYWVMYAPVGQGRGIFEHIEGMVSLFDSLATALLNLNVDGVDIENVALGNFGTIKDTDNKDYFGFGLGVIISEFINP